MTETTLPKLILKELATKSRKTSELVSILGKSYRHTKSALDTLVLQGKVTKTFLPRSGNTYIYSLGGKRPTGPALTPEIPEIPVPTQEQIETMLLKWSKTKWEPVMFSLAPVLPNHIATLCDGSSASEVSKSREQLAKLARLLEATLETVQRTLLAAPIENPNGNHKELARELRSNNPGSL